MEPRYRVRAVINLVNLSTPLGLLAAKAGRGRLTEGPSGLRLAYGYRLRVPAAPAFTVGNVVLLRDADPPGDPLLAHEGRHATQYAFCVGPVMIALYGVASGVSWLACGDYSSYNPFERLAGLADGGYEKRPLRFTRRAPRTPPE